ncbi:hypothetical protein DM860_011103 [Cuscuta australis]|uniref:S-acyltransferase n=1 Tax=Cuscuta australis TaxID=267555 RepID=A0A328E590_9ASTE|nr:hypothetical protein DM860_011103 [Cuscuta australis]
MAEIPRLYQVWKGNNKFLLNGRLVFGPDAKALIVTVMLIVLPVGVFCAFVAREFQHHSQECNAGYVIMSVAIILTVSVLVFLFLTASRDPGIVPRNSHPPDEILNCYSSAPAVSSNEKCVPHTKEVRVNGLAVRVKYCDTCMVFRPPRCTHCKICDNCVERFDHHCPWLGQCIGKRNYRCFFLFVSSAAVLCGFVLSMTALHIKFVVDEHGNQWRAIKESPASLALMADCFVSLWFVGGLTVFHLYLISQNKTTYENVRNRGDNKRINVYSLGCMSNCNEVFCTRVEAPRINFQGYAADEAASAAAPNSNNKAGGGCMKNEAIMEENHPSRVRVKVEDDVDIGDVLLKLSRRRNYSQDIHGIFGTPPPHKSPPPES